MTRRIIEGLGLGLARRAARKLVPVVLTLGSGPSSFPRKFSRRRLKLPRQPGRGASLALASVILALGACPSRNKFPGDGRSFRDSRGKPAPSLARALSFWRWGLARRASRKIFPGDGQSFCDSFCRWGVAGRASRNNFPSDARRRDLGRPVAAMAVLSTRSGQMARSPDGRFQTVPYKEAISGQAKPFLSRACRFANLSRPASRSGRFVKPRRGALLALASVILALGAGPLLPETTFRATAEASATAMANPRRRSHALRCSGAGGWSVGLPPTASLALFRRFGAGG